MNNVTVNVSQSWGYYTSFDVDQGDKPVDKEAGGVNQVRGQKLPRSIHYMCWARGLTNFNFNTLCLLELGSVYFQASQA
jgi:hypothetical protein